jgi:hypothetical protein
MDASLNALSEPYGDASGARESAELLRRLLDDLSSTADRRVAPDACEQSPI